MTKLILIALLFSSVAHAESHRVLATSFTHATGPNARWNGTGFACWKNSQGRWAPWGTKGFHAVKMNAAEVGIAHRSLPCGTLVELTYKARDGKTRRALAPVIDRGPYWATSALCLPKFSHACWKRGKPMERLRPGWRYMNAVDMTVRVAVELQFPGMGMVLFRRVLRTVKR